MQTTKPTSSKLKSNSLKEVRQSLAPSPQISEKTGEKDRCFAVRNEPRAQPQACPRHPDQPTTPELKAPPDLKVPNSAYQTLAPQQAVWRALIGSAKSRGPPSPAPRARSQNAGKVHGSRLGEVGKDV